MAGAYIAAEQGSGAVLSRLIPLPAIDEQLLWVRQWHNDVDPTMDMRPGDYFTSWLGEQLNSHGWSSETLADRQFEQVYEDADFSGQLERVQGQSGSDA